MKKTFFTGLLCCLYWIGAVAQTGNYKMAGNTIATEWAGKVDVSAPLPEYPRPQMVRANWINLNGIWQCAITPAQQSAMPAQTQLILVPFAVESSLSGVGKTVGKDSILWYSRQLTIPAKFAKQTILLHFGAVDWRTEVYINGTLATTHEGGYDPFSIDITPYLKKGTQQLTLKVWDPSDDGPQPRGKQVKTPKSIWYTPVTGIWQTVWMEPVPKTYIASTRNTPDVNAGTVNISAVVNGMQQGDVIRVSAYNGSTKIAEQNIAGNEVAVLKIDNPQLWQPGNPFLYDLKVGLVRNNKVVDEVQSYFAMRKISVGEDEKGIKRMLLNDRFVFQYGPLDQGWWPDGLYTAPTDVALKFDVVQTKAMGFNMIRKHVKVEPARWYYHCDKEGMLVWQDMPSGDLGAKWEMRPGLEGIGYDMERKPESEAIYRKEWKAIMETLHNFPSIVVWVPFNEAWGQFKTAEITQWTKQMDPSRLVNSASGGNFFGIGEIMDLHNYPPPVMPRADLFGAKHVLVLGEFGGLGLPVEGHTWQEKNNWGYQSFKNPTELYDKYESFIKNLHPLINRGLSAAVYTQTTDVEIETNGLMTYDRKVMKMPADKLKSIHQKLYDPQLVKLK